MARPRKSVGTQLGGGGHGARRRSKKRWPAVLHTRRGQPSFIVDARAPSGPADGRQWRLGETRGRTTPVGPLVAARWYGDAERKVPSTCARAWGRGGLKERFLGWRARAGTEATGCGREAAQARGDAVPARARRAPTWRGVGHPAAAAQCPTLIALNSKKLYRSAPSGE
jgi:hypothetical protein